MSYFVVRDPAQSPWNPASFPYTVYEGRENIAGRRRVVTVTQTMRGAKKAIQRDQSIPTLAHAVYDFADLPDLRLSELAPS